MAHGELSRPTFLTLVGTYRPLPYGGEKPPSGPPLTQGCSKNQKTAWMSQGSEETRKLPSPGRGCWSLRQGVGGDYTRDIGEVSKAECLGVWRGEGWNMRSRAGWMSTGRFRPSCWHGTRRGGCAQPGWHTAQCLWEFRQEGPSCLRISFGRL